jgi:DNA repair protein RadC
MNAPAYDVVVQFPSAALPPRRTRRQREDVLIQRALSILFRRMGTRGELMGSAQAVKDYLRLHLGGRGHEVFVVLFLDTKNRLIACDEMFRGTLTHTSVYPREIVKAALAHNAASVMFGHNHPSGCVDPSEADQRITDVLKQALGLIDVRVLDHIIVTATESYSFAEHGLI